MSWIKQSNSASDHVAWQLASNLTCRLDSADFKSVKVTNPGCDNGCQMACNVTRAWKVLRHYLFEQLKCYTEACQALMVT